MEALSEPRNGEILPEAPDGFDATLELAWLHPLDYSPPILHQKFQGAFRFVWVRVPTFHVPARA